MGAVLHAQCVAHALVCGELPLPADLKDAVRVAARLPEMLETDRELTFWRVAFEEEAGDFGEAWATALAEAGKAVSVAAACSGGTGEERYRTIVDGLRLRDPARRGSGMLTAVAAAALAWCEPRAGEAMCIAANTLGTDTDTIATMSGAILGATLEADPPVDVLDAGVIRKDADRMAEIAAGGHPANHRYPDLMRWVAPRTRADALARSKNGELEVRGLGRGTRLTEDKDLVAHGFRWRWLKLDCGQTLLVKGREHLPCSEDMREPERSRRETVAPSRGSARDGFSHESPQPTDAVARDTGHEKPLEHEAAHDIQEVVSYVREHIQDDRIIGRALRRVVLKGTAGEIAAFTAALVDLLRDGVRRARP